MKACLLYGKHHLEIKQQIEILIRFGADVYLANNSGEFPLDLCSPEVKQASFREIPVQNQLKRSQTFESGLSAKFANQEQKRKRV